MAVMATAKIRLEVACFKVVALYVFQSCRRVSRWLANRIMVGFMEEKRSFVERWEEDERQMFSYAASEQELISQVQYSSCCLQIDKKEIT